MKHLHGSQTSHHMVESKSSLKEYLKFTVIIIAIAVTAGFLNDGSWLEYFRWFMGIFFVVFASFKFIGYRMFALMFAGYDVIAKRFMPYAYAYPFIELGLGILYLADWFPAGRDVITIIIFGIGTIGVLQEVKKRSGVHCACLGNVIKLPLSTVSLVEDVGMVLMAAVMFALR